MENIDFVCKFNMTESTLGVPRTQSRIWSQAALAADSALDSFRALMMAAPLCCTNATYSVSNLRQIKQLNNLKAINKHRKDSEGVKTQNCHTSAETRNLGLPMIICNKFFDRLFTNAGDCNGMMSIWVLAGRMVSPYNYILHIASLNI